jgi:hypothetical protein
MLFTYVFWAIFLGMCYLLFSSCDLPKLTFILQVSSA